MLAPKKLMGFGLRRMSSWQLIGSAVLERKAVTVKKFSALEKVYYDILSQTEDENSLLSDFELRARAEKKSREKKKEGSAQVKIQLAEDLLADWKQEAERIKAKLSYTPVTDVRSHERCLDQPVTLLVKQKIGNDSLWCFPESAHKRGETLRQTAERAISEAVGDKLQYVTLGNAPCAAYSYKYPKQVQESTGFHGAKIFFFRARYQKGDLVCNKKIVEDHMWATFDEVMENLPAKMAKAVRPSFFVPPVVDFTPFLDAISDRDELERLDVAFKNG
ncbi:39S ribosomal protein L46, mitochondrial [Galendromus occidentalis]|uniref:Large ribosomal subunit protein mL46 n=1 Tax=Galendromus occidentalis TaxID=34638 RepID=A0AAJ6QSF2_9ACAR|nr:39S ribosomal protein L46, mitochondrial [Galendromus occidentalis]